MKGSLSSLVILLAGMMLLSAIPLNAKLITDPPSGQGVSTIGTGGDYASLADAAVAFSGLSGGLTGDWTIEILNDLTEPSNSWFGNLTNGYTVTLKPATGVTATITFTRTTDNASPSGAMIIGVPGDAWTPLMKTDNFVIDGSNNGTTSRDLTLTIPATVTFAFNTPVHVLGDSDNFVLKNCNILNLSPGTGGSISCIRFTTRWDGGVAYTPDGWTVQNNYLQVQAATQGHGMNITFGGTRGAAGENGAMKNITIDGNTIRSRLRGIFINDGFNYTISNNVVENSIGSGVSGFNHFAVFYNSTNGPATAYHNVFNNVIIQETANTSAGNFGGTALGLTSIGSGANVVANVYNNIIVTRSVVATANANASVLRGIHCTSGVTYNIYNNSIYIPNNPNLTGLTAQGGCWGIGGWATTVASFVNLRNNIVTVKQRGGALATGPAAIYRTENATSTTVSDNNVLYADSSANINTGYKGTTAPGTRYETLNDWQTGTGLDVASMNMDATAVWVSATDLRYSGDPGSAWKFGADVSGIPTLAQDIDGADRDVIVPYVGAHSPVAPNRTITVASAYGSPVPAVGVHNTTSNTLVNAGVDSPAPVSPGTRIFCSGFTGDGDAPSGATNAVSFTLVNNSSITWNWLQQQHQLTVAINPPGAGTVTPADGSWHDANAVIAVQAFENAGWAFDSWSGDLTGSVNPSNLTMDAPKSVTANFVPAPYAEGADFKIFAGPKADIYDQAEALLEVAVSSTDLIQGVTGELTGFGFHPATVGGAANLTNGTFDPSGLTVIGADTDASSLPSFTIEYDFSAGGEVADVTGIRIFSGHDGSGGSRVFINAKVEVDSGFGYTELGNLRTGSFGLAAPGGSNSAVAYVEWFGTANDVEKIRFTFENVSHSDTGFFQAPDDNTTNPPLNYPNQGTVLKEIDLFGTKTLSVREWDLY